MSSIPATAAGGDPSVLPQVRVLLPVLAELCQLPLLFGKGQMSN